MHKIVGGGAGGLELATRLGDSLGKKSLAHVTLIDAARTHIWKPLLYEVATGTLDSHADQLEYLARPAGTISASASAACTAWTAPARKCWWPPPWMPTATRSRPGGAFPKLSSQRESASGS